MVSNSAVLDCLLSSGGRKLSGSVKGRSMVSRVMSDWTESKESISLVFGC